MENKYPKWLLNAKPVGWGLEPAMHGPEERNMDYLLTTGHLKNLLKDFQNFKDTGATIARTGLRTRYANPKEDVYDFKNAIEQAIVARICGIRLLWDLSHYDLPRYIKDPFSDELTIAFKKMALEFIKTMKSIGVDEFGICVFNEMEFWSLCVDANDGWMRPNPITPEQVGKWRLQCIKTTLEVMKAVHRVHPDIPFLIAEPANHHLFKNALKDLFAYDAEQAKKLILGLNAYPHSDQPASREDPVKYFCKLINYIKKNYPENMLIISETGYYGDERVMWIQKMEEIMQKSKIHSTIWYPALDHESWGNVEQIIPHGGWNQDDNRTPYEPLLKEIRRINKVDS